MLLFQAQDKLKSANQRLGQLHRQFIWNYDIITELETEKIRLEKIVADKTAKNTAAQWIWEI